MNKTEQQPLLLASSSRYRQALLQRLNIEFTTYSPNIDESALANELPADLALRLAHAKAEIALQHNPEQLVIASDQVCAFGLQVLSKPGHRQANINQLKLFSGQAVDFYTAVAVGVAKQPLQCHLDHTQVVFRSLTTAEIESYVDTEQAFDCAGGFKVESMGPMLFEQVESSDPTALVGLPLVATCRLLREFGLLLP